MHCLSFIIVILCMGAKQGWGVGGVASLPQFWRGGGGVEQLSTPPDFEKKFIRGVGSP